MPQRKKFILDYFIFKDYNDCRENSIKRSGINKQSLARKATEKSSTYSIIWRSMFCFVFFTIMLAHEGKT